MFFATYAKEIVATALPIVLWVLTYLTRGKVKLQFAAPHQFTFLIDEPVLDENKNVVAPKQTVHTIAYLLMNRGSKPATKVEVVFNTRPRYLNLWPIRHFNEYTEQDGRYVLIFDSLAPGEFLRLHVFSIREKSPDILNVRSDEAVGQLIATWITKQYPKWILNGFRLLAFIGFGAVIFLLLQLLQFIVLRSPLSH